MKQTELETKNKLISQSFNDPRKLKYPPEEVRLKLDDELFSESEIFQTDDGEYIYFDVQISDFHEEELVRYVEIAEKLYEIVKEQVYIYILCAKTANVFVKEFEILSEATFTIRLARDDSDPAEIILNVIKRKIADHELLDKDDIHALLMIPMICDKEKINHYRLESFRILNRFH
ncbi:hypothetical protein [Methanobrevibacter sp.]|uniref:hypothetical protein n=1 Tax=Methanobrevibacter sp. TaxID=66852 RepID=UPI003890C63C